MKRICLSFALVALVFCLGCGSSTSSGPPPKGNFSNASLSGQYAYSVTGFNLNTGAPYSEAGVFTADGNGNLTSGTDDFSQGSVLTGSVSGKYSISNDGTGTATINVSNGRSVSFAFTLVSSSKVYVIVAATNFLATGFGTAEKQDSTAFAAPPSGTFAFKWHNISATSVPSANVGAFTVTSGSVAGNEDVLALGGIPNSLTLTGQFNAPDTSGRGSGSFLDSSNVTSTFIYYVLNSSKIRFFMTGGVLGGGSAEKQSTTTFNTASFSGGYAFGSVGDTNSFFGGVNSAGAYTADGNGGISSGGTYDSVQDGNVTSNASISGTYQVTPNGRVTVSLNAGAIQQILWLVSPSRAFFLFDDSNKVEDGTLDLRQTGSFSNSTMNGQFALVMDGVDLVLGNTFDRVGTLQWNGIGQLGLNEAINFNGTTSFPGFLPGSYSVSSNGRATGTIGGLSNNLIFYLVSGSNAYVLQTDAGVEISGVMSMQSQ